MPINPGDFERKKLVTGEVELHSAEKARFFARIHRPIDRHPAERARCNAMTTPDKSDDPEPHIFWFLAS
jgi:hypothetical protein